MAFSKFLATPARTGIVSPDLGFTNWGASLGMTWQPFVYAVKVKLLWIKLAAKPLHHFLISLVGGIADNLQ